MKSDASKKLIILISIK